MLLLIALASFLSVSPFLSAGEPEAPPPGGEKEENPFGKFLNFNEYFERDCPMCGWDWKTKKSNDKPFSGKVFDPDTGESVYNPDRDFTGTFEPGTTCPACGGNGKLVDRIDWTEGAVHALGVGVGREKTPEDAGDSFVAQQKLLAQRAAGNRAIANALQILTGIRLADKKPPAKNFVAHINAVVKGHEPTARKTSEKTERVWAIVEMKIPLWGVKSLTTGVFGEFKKAYIRKYGLKAGDVKIRTEVETETYIVLDLRGQMHDPVVFPRIEKEDGEVLIDVTTVHPDTVKSNGMCRYHYSSGDEKSFEELKKELEGAFAPKSGKKVRFAFVKPLPEDILCCSLPGPLAGEPRKKRRKMRKLVFKAKGDESGANAKLVVSAEDAKKIAEADNEDDAAKKGNIIVITDSRVAGKEGFLPKKHGWKYAKK
jgi:hypothetical protein